MEYHQLQIFIHRPWTSKVAVPDSPGGLGYLHARGQCLHSATEISKLLRLYDTHYTFRRMNIQIVHIIFSAALIMIFATVSRRAEQGLTEEASNLGVCFRALDELCHCFDIAKTSREFLLSIRKRWTEMRRGGRVLKRLSETRDPASSQIPKKLKAVEQPKVPPIQSTFVSDFTMLHDQFDESIIRSMEDQVWALDYDQPSYTVES